MPQLIIPDLDAVTLARLQARAAAHGRTPQDEARSILAETTQPVADFLEPIEYAWTEAGFEARQALKKYSEATHADH